MKVNDKLPLCKADLLNTEKTEEDCFINSKIRGWKSQRRSKQQQQQQKESTNCWLFFLDMKWLHRFGIPFTWSGQKYGIK